MKATVTVACAQVEPVVLDREATVDKLAEHTAEAAGAGTELVAFPETFVSVFPSSSGRRRSPVGRIRARRRRSPSSSSQSWGPRPGCRSTRRDRAGALRLARVGVNEVDSTRNGATRAPLPRPGRLARPRASQAHPHEPRAARLKTGRWGRVASARDAARTYRRPHLLGELHAACPVLAVRVRRGDLPRVHRRRRGRMAGDPRAHRPLTPNQSS